MHSYHTMYELNTTVTFSSVIDGIDAVTLDIIEAPSTVVDAVVDVVPSVANHAEHYIAIDTELSDVAS